MGNEDQALTAHTKNKKREHSHHKKEKHHDWNQRDNLRIPRRDQSNVRCYTCDEKGHFSRDCPKNKKKKNNKKRHHAHNAEDDEPPRKRTKGDSEDSSSDEEYVLISSLMGTVTNGSNDWIIDSVASKHMMGFKESFLKLSEHESLTR